MNLRAYAKINIGLRILGKRTDGYHDIETIFHEVDLYDEISLEPSDDVRFLTSSTTIPTDDRNLCVKAAHALRTQTHFRGGARICLTKKIPVGAGLGGGSSDAAIVLHGLNLLWHTALPPSELEKIAAPLGSDVPFFIRGGSALGTSKGEVLTALELHIPYWILTVTPSIHISTAWAYSHLQLTDSKRAGTFDSFVQRGLVDRQALAATVTNDFESTVFQSYPEIGQLKEKLMSLGAAFAQMSGSGSSVYGFFGEERVARKAQDTFKPFVTSLTAPEFKRRTVQ